MQLKLLPDVLDLEKLLQILKVKTLSYIDNMCMHLTNYSINKNSDKFDDAEGDETRYKSVVAGLYGQVSTQHCVV